MTPVLRRQLAEVRAGILTWSGEEEQMDDPTMAILAQLLPEEKEVVVKKRSLPTDVDHWSKPIMLERTAYLRQMARHGEGSAGETLKEFPHHTAMLSVRNRNGEAELHARFADLFYVLDGKATLLTGGTITGSRETAPGEIRGHSIEGGKRQELRSGDLAHIPAGVPHQMLVSEENTFSAFVLKIEEQDTESFAESQKRF